MRRLRSPLLVLALVIPLVGLLLLISDGPAPRLPAPPEDAPKAIVALGDSTLSGEGAGDYEPGTDGDNGTGNWCHRSTKAMINKLSVPDIATTVNLACSGARAANLVDKPQHNEGPQVPKLLEIARQFRIAAIVVQIGANDEPGFSSVVKECAEAWFKSSTKGCSGPLTTSWGERVDKMVPKVAAALRKIRDGMRENGYPDASYQLVVQSYAAPVGRAVVSSLRNLGGCPFQSGDLEWVQDKAVGELAAGLRAAAATVDARFLDLSRAGAGREACSTSGSGAGEWFTRLTVRWKDLGDEQRSAHAIQESFHPNAAGHEQFASCLSAFLATTDRAAACVADPAKNLVPVAGAATAARAAR
ncbi:MULTISPECIES: GDSL-type esterase/lipase family protein [unclassified Crossiella]|uniref:GDSL-type esterase/lipase family protein n=1 Tax=unclassified Crossiella TaxID=2620835 RepID=UPI001FFFF9BB|nr:MULTISPECIES: GDSL-type esterase/lipase family protein [unclassified Crossiella]MCK2242753.1 GDSL-type esterase/lipase family protein [Crossiella sp. S99.2]MCK2256630.1 GDSL-type esterase/lipase family protein [Crossiella sp. S99.1]